MFTPSRLIIFFFAAVIAAGALLLYFETNYEGHKISVIDSLFTATSAVCVTGLTVVDTGSFFSSTGQLIILLLIQTGGLGIITLSSAYLFIFGSTHHFTTKEASRMSYTPDANVKLGSVLRLTLLYTFSIEAVGASILFLRWTGDHSLADAAWLSIFHAVSAFCNAGFSLFSDSLAGYCFDPVINLIICGLIIFGGMGFFVIFEIHNRTTINSGMKFKRFSLHTKIVIIMTGILIAGGMLGFMVLEWGNVLKDVPVGGKLFISFFQSVTPRTAGFNTVDMGSLTDCTLFMIIMLMIIGASPGSTGGGIKTISFGILMSAVISKIKGSDSIHVFERRIPESSVNRVLALVAFAFTFIVIITMLVSIAEFGGTSHTEMSGSFFEVFFEVVSAFGTVGLSLGLTPKLTSIGKLLIIATMFIGRVGPLTLAVILRERIRRTKVSYPDEDLMIG